MMELTQEEARNILRLMTCCRHGEENFGPNLARSFRSFVLNTSTKPEVRAAFDHLSEMVNMPGGPVRPTPPSGRRPVKKSKGTEERMEDEKEETDGREL